MDAIAMISGSQSGFIGASEIAALIGVLIIGFQAILRTQINIHHLLVCYVVYMGCFSITTDVAIESVHGDKTVIQKDNVPYGPAVLGSVISTIGYGLTKKMELAFSDVDQAKFTDGNFDGFINPLYILNNLANWSENGAVLQLVERTPEGKDFGKNYQTYIKDCTLKALYLGRKYGGITYDEIFSKKDGIQFNSELYGTEFIKTNGTAEVYSCKEAYPVLKQQLASAMTTLTTDSQVEKQMLSKIGKCKHSQVQCLQDLNNHPPIETVKDAIDALSIAGSNAQDFMEAAMIDNLKKTGLAAGFSHYHDIQSANMMLQTVKQRNLQWATEGNMFLNAMPSVLAFIEGFFYAISPFAAVIILLGMFGLNIFFKYILMLVWIQLWTPIMAIGNLFIITAAKEAIQNVSFGYDSSAGLSTYLYEDIVQVCQDKIAIGSMMLAATPVLSLMIITGSVYAFTQLTNRIAGADHFNEKALAPDLMSPAAVFGQQAKYTGNSIGYNRNGVVDDNLNTGLELQQASSSAKENMLTTQQSLATSMSDTFTEMGKEGWGKDTVGMFNKVTSHATGTDLSQAIQATQQLAARHGIHLNTTQAKNVALGLSLMGNGVNEANGFKKDEIEAYEKLKNDQSSFGEVTKATIAKNVASSLSDGFKHDNSYSKSGEHAESFSKNAQEINASSEKFATVSSYAEKVGSGATFKWKEAVDNAVHNLGNDKVRQMIDSKISSLNANQRSLFNAAYKDYANKLGNLGSNSNEVYQLRALKDVDQAGTAILLADLTHNATGVGMGVSKFNKTVSDATTNYLPHTDGVDQATIANIQGKAENAINNGKAASQQYTPEKWAKKNDKEVEAQAEAAQNAMREKEENRKVESETDSYRRNGMFRKNKVEELGFIDKAVNPSDKLDAITTFVKNAVESVSKGGGISDNKLSYAELMEKGKELTAEQFDVLKNGRNDALVDAAHNAYVAGLIQRASTSPETVAFNVAKDLKDVITTNGDLKEVISNSLDSAARNNTEYNNAMKNFETVAQNYAKNNLNITNKDEVDNFAQNYINLTNNAVEVSDPEYRGGLFMALGTK
jgi:conjugal transfer mating pair stabilization protein TraG